MFSWLEYELHQLDRLEYNLLLIIVSAISIGFLYSGYQVYRRFRIMSGTATSKIRSAPQGYVELKGVGEWMPGDSIHSPFSGRRCLWYQCTLDRRKRSKKRTSWTNISNQVSDQLFHLVDETGKCVIDPENAHVVPEVEKQWFGDSMDAKANLPESSFSFSQKSYRFTEKIITPATEIYLLGNFQTKRHVPAESFVESETKALILEWKLKPAKYLSKFNHDANDIIQDREWNAIRQAARRQVLATLTRQNEAQNLMSKPAHTDQPYILSATPEEKLLKKKKWKAIFAFLVGFTLVGGILFCLSARPVV